jgi:ATP-binding cassette subfamily C protein LapB
MHEQLLATILRLSQIQGQLIDRLELQASFEAIGDRQIESRQLIHEILSSLQLPKAEWIAAGHLDQTHVPAIIFIADRGWAILRGKNGLNQWVSESFDLNQNKWLEQVLDHLDDYPIARLKLAKAYDAHNSPVYKMIRDAVFQNRSLLLEIVLGGVMINLIALATSLYSLQVYDRVVPTGAAQTLLALTLGVAGAIIFELIIKLVRSNLNERLVDSVDSQLARAIYTKFLAVRMDQMPKSVGALAGQLRGYETVRGFLAAVTTQLLVDLPFLLIYILVVAGIAGWLGFIPLGFMLISIGLGLFFRKKIEYLTQKSNQAANLKTGLLVETIDGAETIKSGQGGWRMLMRWLDATDEARLSDLEMRHVSEHSQYWIAMLHQISYVSIVATGALLVSAGGLTMGGLIACTILSGRILGPIGTLPNILVQWGHCKAALQGLDKIWMLESDHHGIDHPITLEKVTGAYDLEQIEIGYGNNKALQIPKLVIKPGEKIGVLGPIGAGKTTFLRLLTGMYRPQKGTIKLDGVDMLHITKPVLAEQVGYLQQEGRLFAGTLKHNLILGMIDPGDQSVLDVCKMTGLQQSVIDGHPLGINQIITEGGVGLSGGQKQLTNLTRVFLRKPRIWLLDEPTANLDRNTEILVMRALADQLRQDVTMVLVTHKPEMLALVDRIIVVANHQIILDGPKAEVIKKLQGQPAQSNAIQSPVGYV